MNNLGQGLGSMALQADQHMAQVETQKQQLLGGLKSFKAGVSQLDSALKSVGDDKALKAVDELLNKSSSVKELASNAGGLLGSLSGQMNDTWQGTARKLGEVANGGEVSENARRHSKEAATDHVVPFVREWRSCSLARAGKCVQRDHVAAAKQGGAQSRCACYSSFQMHGRQ